MVNNTPESKFDETIKSTLDKYEAQYDPSDWSKMESMLDAAPKSGNFKWSHVIAVVVAVAVIGGGYAIYNGLNDPKNSEPGTTTIPAPVNKTEPKPSAKPRIIPPPPSTAKTEPVKEEKITTPVVTGNTVTKTNTAEPKIKKEKKTSETIKSPVIESNDRIIGMGNEPIFGDMLDSSKGIIGETREKEETKKAAKAKKGTPVGWDKFMLPNVNADSLRKYREKRDSSKTD